MRRVCLIGEGGDSSLVRGRGELSPVKDTLVLRLVALLLGLAWLEALQHQVELLLIWASFAFLSSQEFRIFVGSNRLAHNCTVYFSSCYIVLETVFESDEVSHSSSIKWLAGFSTLREFGL
jgi:hypothetical protein